MSPIASHPDTAILDETLESVRYHLPDSEIILTFDGVRPEQAHRRGDYEEFIRQALWRADHHYGNVLPLIFDRHQHQSGMMRAVLDRLDTSLLMYVEQDTPLVTDASIDFCAIADFIQSGRSDLVRLHHESVLPAEHERMVHGHEVGYLRTSQWSQRPHVSTRAFYRRIMSCHFSPDARSFIEDPMHGVVDEAYRRDGMHGWQQYRLHIYDPGGSLKRSYHTDGRAGEAKYGQEF